jgi:2-hydroxychromene-2-carboxylate isomerase
MKTLEFYYGLVSPYSYLACGEVSRVCREHGAELSLRPMLLGAVQNAVGLQAPIKTKPKARYQARDIQRWAGPYALPMAFPNPCPVLGQRPAHFDERALGRLKGQDAVPWRAPARRVNMGRQGSDERQGKQTCGLVGKG